MFEELDRSDRQLKAKPVRSELSGKLALVQQLLKAIKASKSGAPGEQKRVEEGERR